MIIGFYSPGNDARGIWMEVEADSYTTFIANTFRVANIIGHIMQDTVNPSGPRHDMRRFTTLDEALRDFMYRCTPPVEEEKVLEPTGVQEPIDVQEQLDQALADAVYASALYREAVASTALDRDQTHSVE